ncbi:hypothetical protein SAY87_020428 [Trapa incisa]|uniref:Uncharacterized protein n=1 Tax=Trapa incisa TaxID=236973 RepID=A0AAN7K7R5_9MYRT|nr:hypothetical protein SAY87_020428 [Trapa incisa]
MMEDLLLDQAQEAHVSDGKWFILDEEVKQLTWTSSENKMFERALAVHDEDNPDRWHRVAVLIPGKTVADVSNIEAGLVPVPGYNSSSEFTFEWANRNGHSHGFDGVYKQAYGHLCGKRYSSARRPENERKKGVPWTEEEHKLKKMFSLAAKTRGGRAYTDITTVNLDQAGSPSSGCGRWSCSPAPSQATNLRNPVQWNPC